MCFGKSSGSAVGATIATTDNQEAQNTADIEARLRRRRRGAAGNVLTGAMGIPSNAKMGGAA